jgi:hypothetical protein
MVYFMFLCRPLTKLPKIPETQKHEKRKKSAMARHRELEGWGGVDLSRD